MAYGFNPPGIDSGGEIRMRDQVLIQCPFLHDLATGQVDENALILHAAKLGGANQAGGGAGKRRTDQQNVGRLQELVQPLRCSDPVYPLICPTTPVDGVTRIPIPCMSRAAAAPMPPKPKIPQTRPASMRLRVN